MTTELKNEYERITEMANKCHRLDMLRIACDAVSYHLRRASDDASTIEREHKPENRNFADLAFAGVIKDYPTKHEGRCLVRWAAIPIIRAEIERITGQTISFPTDDGRGYYPYYKGGVVVHQYEPSGEQQRLIDQKTCPKCGFGPCDEHGTNDDRLA